MIELLCAAHAARPVGTRTAETRTAKPRAVGPCTAGPRAATPRIWDCARAGGAYESTWKQRGWLGRWPFACLSSIPGRNHLLLLHAVAGLSWGCRAGQRRLVSARRAGHAAVSAAGGVCRDGFLVRSPGSPHQ